MTKEDKIVGHFNRWFRIAVGIGFLMASFDYWDWATFSFGIGFIY